MSKNMTLCGFYVFLEYWEKRPKTILERRAIVSKEGKFQ